MVMWWVTHRTDIPSWLAVGTGRIVAEYADLEWQFEDAIRILLETGVKSARIVATGMNMRTRASCAEYLAMAHELKPALIASLRALGTNAEKMKRERDQLAHGLWGKVNGDWYVLRNSGTRTVPEFGSLPRAVLPQRELVTRKTIATVRKKIKTARAQMKEARKLLRDALPPSPHKSPEQHRQGPIPRGRRRTPKAPSRPL